MMAAMVVGFGIGGLPSATAVGVRVSKAAVGVFVVERPRVYLGVFSISSFVKVRPARFKKECSYNQTQGGVRPCDIQVSLLGRAAE